MKKSIALLIVVLLVLPMLSLAAPVRASTGAPVIIAVQPTGVGTGNGFGGLQNTTVEIKAGNMYVKSVSGMLVTPDTYIFGLVTRINATPYVNWEGSQFDLYISKNGYGYFTEGDKKYASGFDRLALNTPLNTSAPVYKYMNTSTPDAWFMKDDATPFWLGTVDINGTSYQVILGAIPFDITSDYKFIKIIDSAPTSAAVTVQFTVLAALNLVPTSGPGGLQVCLSGVALAPNTLYNITYANSSIAAAQVLSSSDGKINFCWNVKDLCKAYWDPTYNETIYIDVWTNATAQFIDEVRYTEMYRVLTHLDTTYSSITGSFGNLSSPTQITSFNVFVLDDLQIMGDWFNPTGPVTVYFGTINVGSVTPLANGTFDVTVTVPVLPNGPVNVTLDNVGCKFMFTVIVQPTLIVTPDTGPIGTNVNFTAYGFPQNSLVTLWWEVNYACDFKCDYVAIMNVTVDNTGQFNMTTNFVVPKQPGGPHWIVATEAVENNCTDDWPGYYYTFIAETFFTVTPTLWVTPSSFNEDGTTFWINGTGFDPFFAYVINVDNQAYAVPTTGYFANDYWWYWTDQKWAPFDWTTAMWVYNPSDHFVVSDLCGDISIKLVKAGFGPGLHVVSLTASQWNDYWMYSDPYTYANMMDGGSPYPEEHIWFGTWAQEYPGVNWNLGYYPTDVYATFTVTAVGNPIVDTILTNVTSQLTSINARIVSIEGDVATLTTDVGQLQVSVAALDAKVVALQGSVATIQTTLGTMTGTLNTISGNTATILTDVGIIKADVKAMKPFLPVDMMPVWIAVIFAIIAAIASIYGVLVIRSKIAQ